MSYAIFTDSCANLPGDLLRQLDISVMPCSYRIGGKEISFNGDIEHFDAKAHYDLLRAGEVISTSLINADAFLAAFRPVLAQGRDLVYVGISSGISGTFQAATMAVTELKEEFPDRTIRAVDSMGHIVSCGKYRGRKRAVEAIVQKYAELAVNPEHSRVAITHGDCLADAEDLAMRVRAVAQPGELIICPHEPFTGSHVGPGMLALFFLGSHR